ncbi:hypothetical protein [Glycomyces sp. MUSA5-2]|uniref:hypothetical protein n=1 Tax=Glycomyces sp. MUSA5-2 TaxID=2053002 RepID=UPI00300A08F9
MMNSSNRLRRKLNRTALHLTALLAAVLASVFAVPSAAMAEANYFQDCELERVACVYGTKVAGPIGECMTANAAHGSTQVCIQYDGDYVYVRDGDKDGYGATALVYTEFGSINHRWCANAEGYGTWVRCNFDWREDGDHAVAGGYLIQYYEEVMMQLWWWSGK